MPMLISRAAIIAFAILMRRHAAIIDYVTTISQMLCLIFRHAERVIDCLILRFAAILMSC